MSRDRPPSRFRLPFLSRSERGGTLEVRADFEGGNVEAVEVVSAAHVRFEARADASPRPLWFYFSLENALVPAVRCDLLNADACFGPRLGWGSVRPVFSADGAVWERVNRAHYLSSNGGPGLFTFTVPIVGRATRVAYCYPYTTADLDCFLRVLRPHPAVEEGVLGRSTEGRPVPYLRIGVRESPARTVWIIARQHAGETPASFVVEGVLQALTAGTPEARAQLASTEFHVLPMLDVDGVFHGRYGKDQEPVDFNRDWRDHPVRLEIAELLRRLRAAQQLRGVDLVLDIHAPHHGDTSVYLFGQPVSSNRGDEEAQTRYMRRLAAVSPPRIGLRDTDIRTDYCPARSARDYLWRQLRIPVLTFEVSYHLAQTGLYLTPKDYREFGESLVRALPAYFSPTLSSG